MTLDAEGEERLRHLADLNGVSTGFWDWSGNYQQVAAHTLIAVLSELGVPVSDDSDRPQVEAAITWTEDQPWRQTLPACTVVREGSSQEIFVHVPHGRSVQVQVELENGDRVELAQLDWYFDPRSVDGELQGRATFQVPSGLPLGYHQLTATVHLDDELEVVTRPLYVVPNRLEPALLSGRNRYWGVNVQAYSVRSHRSWGLGDAADLADLTAICAQQQADFLLINPLHAAEVVAPVEDSPYLPISRRWLNLTYIRPEAIPEYVQLGPRQQAKIEQARQQAASLPAPRGGGLNRDGSWEAKKEALEQIHPLPRSLHREAQLGAFIEAGGPSLYRYALWCALVERVGSTDLGEEFSSPNAPSVHALEEELAPRIHFYQWCQWVATEQCQEPNRVAHSLGMRVGIMADLAVGVHRFGADYWANPEVFASTMSVGAPPDMYSQQGQDWSQPPLNPRALERAGYQPLREIFAATMRLSGALRIDHILGLFRLWWIPCGERADHGAYVYFDHEAMVGILLLEAHRRGVMVIGEDLGTVEPWVRQYLNERGVLGTSVLWFEKDEHGWPLGADRYRENVLATVNTHDLPPTAGYMEGTHTRLRDRLGLLVEPVEQVMAQDREEQDRMRQRLIEWGLLTEDAGPAEMLEAMHRYIARTPARLVAASLVDAVGEKQPQNLPGTHNEYPNWRIPLSDAEGTPIWLEDLAERPDLNRLFAVMRQEIPRAN